MPFKRTKKSATIKRLWRALSPTCRLHGLHPRSLRLFSASFPFYTIEVNGDLTSCIVSFAFLNCDATTKRTRRLKTTFSYKIAFISCATARMRNSSTAGIRIHANGGGVTTSHCFSSKTQSGIVNYVFCALKLHLVTCEMLKY